MRRQPGRQSTVRPDSRKQQKAELVLGLDLDVLGATDPTPRMDRKLDLESVITFLRSLNPKVATVLSLSLNGLSVRAIADVLHTDHRDVERCFSAARDVLRGAFQGMLP